jgi:hypothetical protein
MTELSGALPIPPKSPHWRWLELRSAVLRGTTPTLCKQEVVGSIPSGSTRAEGAFAGLLALRLEMLGFFEGDFGPRRARPAPTPVPNWAAAMAWIDKVVNPR